MTAVLRNRAILTRFQFRFRFRLLIFILTVPAPVPLHNSEKILKIKLSFTQISIEAVWKQVGSYLELFIFFSCSDLLRTTVMYQCHTVPFYTRNRNLEQCHDSDPVSDHGKNVPVPILFYVTVLSLSKILLSENIYIQYIQVNIFLSTICICVIQLKMLPSIYKTVSFKYCSSVFISVFLVIPWDQTKLLN